MFYLQLFYGRAIFLYVLVMVTTGRAWCVGEDFSSWEKIPGLIESISDENCHEPLEELHRLTMVKLGWPRLSALLDEKEDALYTRETKDRWNAWWQSTGEPIAKRIEKEAVADRDAFAMASEFLGIGEVPETVPKGWIPETWTLFLTFTNGDYGGREKELWIMERQSNAAQLTKLRGDFSKDGWTVTLREIPDFAPDRADRLLKAICYTHRHAPEFDAEVAGEEMEGLYYPGAEIHLSDGENRILWNTKDFAFSKSKPEFGDGESGRTYYFLSSVFPEERDWKAVANPTGGQLAPYRTFLSVNKPYFCRVASDVIQFFGQHGGRPELHAMLEWSVKQKAATDPDMDWRPCSGDFGAEMKVNVINSSRFEIEKTLQEIVRLERVLSSKDPNTEDAAKVDELWDYVSRMQDIARQEKHDALQSRPELLRSLMKVSERTDDHDLAHLSAAINEIRKKPDPMLFSQLATEMHEGTAIIKGLLTNILLDEAGHIDLEPWGDKEEAIAIGACIDSLKLAKKWESLVALILRACGGGKIEMEVQGETRRIEVVPRENGYSTIYGGASNPLPLDQAKKELLRIYKKSRAEKSSD